MARLTANLATIMRIDEQNMLSSLAPRLSVPAELPKWMRYWLWLGMWWMLVGLAASPVGDKIWNPGKPYHDSLLLLFVTPSVAWLWRGRNLFVRRALQTVDGPLLLIFLGWAALSVTWSNYGHFGDAAFVVVYIAVFVLTWGAFTASDPQALQHLLFWAAIGLALSALISMVTFHWRSLNPAISWQIQGRLIAFGSLNNPNLAAFAYGAAMIWLMQTPVRAGLLKWLQLAAFGVMAVFVVLTYSRAAWLAILVAHICMLFVDRQRKNRRRILILLGAATLAIALGGWHYVEQRGLSYRPQIFVQAAHLILAHPWVGLGMGSRYSIYIDGIEWAHSHNAFTHTAIMLGIPAALLWVWLWLIVGWRSWIFRGEATGRCLMALWIYATVAFQFDAPDLLQKPSVEWVLGWLPVAIGMGLVWRARLEKRPI